MCWQMHFSRFVGEFSDVTLALKGCIFNRMGCLRSTIVFDALIQSNIYRLVVIFVVFTLMKLYAFVL